MFTDLINFSSVEKDIVKYKDVNLCSLFFLAESTNSLEINNFPAKRREIHKTVSYTLKLTFCWS